MRTQKPRRRARRPRRSLDEFPADMRPGDYNGDGSVDAADYTVWRDTFGQTDEDLAADGTGPGGMPDGIVDWLDYDLWKANYGSVTNSASGQLNGTHVPEPTAAVLLILAAAIVGLLDRTNRKLEDDRPYSRQMPLKKVAPSDDSFHENGGDW